MPTLRVTTLPSGIPLVYTSDPYYNHNCGEITIWQDDHDVWDDNVNCGCDPEDGCDCGYLHESLECPGVGCDTCPARDGHQSCRSYFLRTYPFRTHTSVYKRRP